MDTSLHDAFLPQADAENSLASARDLPGLEVRSDVGHSEVR